MHSPELRRQRDMKKGSDMRVERENKVLPRTLREVIASLVLDNTVKNCTSHKDLYTPKELADHQPYN